MRAGRPQGRTPIGYDLSTTKPTQSASAADVRWLVVPQAGGVGGIARRRADLGACRTSP